MPEIREATPSDLPELVRLFDAYRVFYQRPSDAAAAERFLRDRFARRDSQLFVAPFRGAAQAGASPTRSEAQPSEVHLAGFTQLYPTFSSVSMARTYVLNDLFVDPAARRGGVGRALLAAAQAFARAQGAVRVSLDTAVDNHTAQRLYEAFGYRRETAFYRYHQQIS